MAKNDNGYARTKVRSYRGGGGGRSQSWNTWLQRTRKDEVKNYLIREMVNERLEAMGDVPPTSDLGLAIRQGVTEEINNSKDLKSDIAERWNEKRFGNPLRDGRAKSNYIQEAEVLLEALYSATKAKERADLDEGDFLDEVTDAFIEGSGWGEEVIGKPNFQKHVNICIDNSGSTHMAVTGFCSRVMKTVSNSMTRIMKGASKKFEGITWGVYNFNKIARCEMFYGKEFVSNFSWLSDFQGTSFMVEDPLKVNASETRLAPLMEEIYNKESENGLIGEPRLDIILTDGEFENQKDADLASEWQRKRGGNVFTYVLNLCPDMPSDITLPPQFRIIPLNCISESDGIKQVDSEAVRNAMYSIVIEEMCKL